MSNNDSFIEEVTEEVRRDKLFAMLKKYGWIAIVAVLLLVGGAAFNEWKKAQARADAEGLGDAILAALEADDAGARLQALGEIQPGSADQAAVLGLLKAAEAQRAGDREAALQDLAAITDNADTPQLYRDLAAFKRVLIAGPDMGADDRRSVLEDLASPGAAFRLLAEEQLALLEIETGAPDAALTRLRAIIDDAEVTSGLRNRVSQLIVALGGEPEAA